MSTYRVWRIRCEGPDYITDCPTAEARHNSIPVAEIRKGLAQFEGWTSRDSVDRCNGCSQAVAS